MADYGRTIQRAIDNVQRAQELLARDPTISITTIQEISDQSHRIIKITVLVERLKLGKYRDWHDKADGFDR